MAFRVAKGRLQVRLRILDKVEVGAEEGVVYNLLPLTCSQAHDCRQSCVIYLNTVEQTPWKLWARQTP